MQQPIIIDEDGNIRRLRGYSRRARQIRQIIAKKEAEALAQGFTFKNALLTLRYLDESL